MQSWLPNWRRSARRRRLRRRSTDVSDYARQLEIERELWKRQARRDLLSWTIEAQAASGRRPARHHRLLIAELENVATGVTPRLMVQMPPGSAKTTYTSILF